MQYFTFQRFRGTGIDCDFNIRYGTLVNERDGFLYYNGRCICATTSETGWEHFYPNTEEGRLRHTMICKLYDYYRNHDISDDYDILPTSETRNFYWKSLIRTLPTHKLAALYEKRIVECTLLLQKKT